MGNPSIEMIVSVRYSTSIAGIPRESNAFPSSLNSNSSTVPPERSSVANKVCGLKGIDDNNRDLKKKVDMHYLPLEACLKKGSINFIVPLTKGTKSKDSSLAFFDLDDKEAILYDLKR